MSWCSHSLTCIIHLLLTFHPLLLTVFIFFISRIKPNWNWFPSLTLCAFSDLGLVASLRVRWLMELSSANHAHSSHQARGDLTWMNLVLLHGYAGGNKKKTGLTLRWAFNMPTTKINWWVLLLCLAHWLGDDALHHQHVFLLNCRDTSQKFGKWQFCWFSCRNFCQFYRIWCSPKSGPDFGDTLDQTQSDLINRDQAQSVRIGTNQSGSGPTRPDQIRSGVDFGEAPDRRPNFGEQSATMPKNGVLLLRRACPDEPDDGKYEYYYFSYSY